MHIYTTKTRLQLSVGGKSYVELPSGPRSHAGCDGQMALLQFMNAGKSVSAVPATVHCDHLIQAYKGVEEDLLLLALLIKRYTIF